MYEVPSNRPPVRTLPRRQAVLRFLWLLVSSLGAIALAGMIVEHDLAALDVRPAPRPFLVPVGSSVVVFTLTLILAAARAGIATRYQDSPPLRSIPFWLLVGFWSLVGSMVIMVATRTYA